MKATSIQGELFFTHPKFQAAVDRFVEGVKLSLLRAVSQHPEARARAAMPVKADSLEQVFARYLALPRASAQLPAAARAAQLPAVAGVDLADPTPVLEQLTHHSQTTRFGLTADEARAAVRDRRLIGHRPRRDGDDFEFGHDTGGEDPVSRKLIQLRIHKVKCVKETREWGDDEIAMGGFMIDDRGEMIRVPEFYVSKSFSTGETKAYAQPRPFASFVARKDGQRKIVLATLAMAEKDHGGFASFLDEVWSKVTLQATIFAGALYAAVTELLPGWVTGAITAIAPAVLSGLLVGALVGAALTAIFLLLGSMLKDDIFDPVSTAFLIPTIDTPVATPTAVAVYTGHGGKYEVTYDWAIVT